MSKGFVFLLFAVFSFVLWRKRMGLITSTIQKEQEQIEAKYHEGQRQNIIDEKGNDDSADESEEMEPLSCFYCHSVFDDDKLVIWSRFDITFLEKDAVLLPTSIDSTVPCCIYCNLKKIRKEI